MVRTPYFCSKTGLKKGTWTPEEDRKLMAYATRYGCWNWRQLPKYAGLARCGKSCRLRWMNYLRPNIKRGNYTKEEEDTIIKLHELLGNKWSAIAAQLPGRTDNEIKNHWHTCLKKRLNQNSATNEAKGKAKYPFYYETNQEGESKPNIINNSQEEESKPNTDDQNLNPITYPILESCSSSSQPSLSDQLCSITTDTSIVASNNKLTLDVDDFLFRSYAESSGNFWTEPFLADNFYLSTSLLPPLSCPGNVSLHSPCVDEEILWP